MMTLFEEWQATLDDAKRKMAEIDRRARASLERTRGPRRRSEIEEMFADIERDELIRGQALDAEFSFIIDPRSERDGDQMAWQDLGSRLAAARARSPLGFRLKSDFTWERWRAVLCSFDWSCAYCGQRGGTDQDHVVPLSKGGQDLLSNLVPACLPCNSSKWTRSLDEWLASKGPIFAFEARERIALAREKARAA